MTDVAARIAWVVVVVCAGAALVRGLVLTTYFELTPAAQANAERGRWFIWIGTAVLTGLAGLALRRWHVATLALVAVVAAGPVCLAVDNLGWIPLIAAPLVFLQLLVGGANVLLAPRRT